jgi:hypothetical protein
MAKNNNKLTLAIVAVVVAVLLIGSGAYFLLENKNSNSGTTASTGTTDTIKKDNNQILTSIMSDLKAQVPTVEQTYIYTEDKHPNDSLGKQGFYTNGAEFYDTRTNTPPDAVAFGNSSGGSIEVYSNNDFATARENTFSSLGGTTLGGDGYRRINNVLLRVSSQYSASEQQQMLDILQDLVSKYKLSN